MQNNVVVIIPAGSHTANGSTATSTRNICQILFQNPFQECSLKPFHIISLNSQPLRVAVKLTTNVAGGMSAGRQISSRNQNDTRVLGLWGRNGDIVGQISHGSDIPDRQLVSIDDDLDNLNVSRLHR
jgi:hypothetical protein